MHVTKKRCRTASNRGKAMTVEIQKTLIAAAAALFVSPTSKEMAPPLNTLFPQDCKA